MAQLLESPDVGGDDALAAFDSQLQALEVFYNGLVGTLLWSHSIMIRGPTWCLALLLLHSHLLQIGLFSSIVISRHW